MTVWKDRQSATVAQLVRAFGSYPKGQQFESALWYQPKGTLITFSEVWKKLLFCTFLPQHPDVIQFG